MDPPGAWFFASPGRRGGRVSPRQGRPASAGRPGGRGAEDAILRRGTFFRSIGDSLDWKDLAADEIAQRVLQDIHAGDIILLHNNGLHTAEALPLILEGLQKLGLMPVPVSELLLEGDYYIDVNGIQRQK